MQLLRTPDERFAQLPDWPYAPRYAEVTDADGSRLRLHYVDEGPRDGPPVLLLHGEPSWAYLYRHVIAGLVARGRRCIAPDLIGFGRSDKPAARADYTYERHVAWMSQWLTDLDLRNVHLFCQDWGGLIGLRLVAAFPERFAGVVVANTGLPSGSGMTDGFKAWLQMSQTVPVMPIGGIVNMGVARSLSDAEVAAYDAPFPDETYKEGARQFPMLVPVTPEHGSVAENLAAWRVLEAFDKPFVTAFSDGDPITKGGEAVFQSRVPGTRGQPHVTLGGGHFLQEDSAPQIVDVIDALIQRTGGAS
ncbi:MAG: haloalkane dehalogenase [Phenylobacterium zucineum]|nr:MAG: haloalkane dehalogenase [Phenylobacterium zucineum]